MRMVVTSFVVMLSVVSCGPRVLDDIESDGAPAAEAQGVDDEGSGHADDGTEDGHSSASGAPPQPSTITDPSTSTTGATSLDADGESTTADLPPVQGLVGAAFFDDGLCPWNYDYFADPLPLLTLQVSGSSLVCNMVMWNENIELELHPTWFAELHLSFDQIGVYDLAQNPGYAWINVIDPDTSGGSGGGPLDEGVIEITSIDDALVIGSLSGLRVFNLNGVDYDVNGSFAATRCTPEAWLDVEVGEPHDPPLPRGCLHP